MILVLKKNHRGVTLPELMIVIVIMAVASALAFPQLKMMNALRQKTYAYDSLKMIADALRKYNQDFDADILTDTNPDSLFTKLEGKGYIKITELYKQGANYCLDAQNEIKVLGISSDGACGGAGVTFRHGFSMTEGRKGSWLSYEVCSKTECTDLSQKKIDYAAHPESF